MPDVNQLLESLLSEAIVARLADEVAERVAAKVQVTPTPATGGREWFNTKQAADFLGCSTQKLEIDRVKGRGPAYHKGGGLVRYTREALDAYARGDGPQQHTGQDGQRRGRSA